MVKHSQVVLMVAKIEIPCPCGKSVPVTINQCGMIVTCSCGRELAVPSRRELLGTRQTIDEDASVEEEKAPLSGWVRLFQWISGSLAVLALIGLIVLYIYRPRLPDFHKLPPAAAYQYFKVLRTGERSPWLEMEARYVRDHNIWLGLRDIVAVVGIIAIVLFCGVTLAGWWETRSNRKEEDEIVEPPGAESEGTESPS